MAQEHPTLKCALALALWISFAHANAQQAGAPSELPAVVVEAQASRPPQDASLDAISSDPIERTPLAIDAIDAAQILDRGVQSLSGAIRADPAVGDNYNTFGYIEALQIRGFTLNELLNYQRDGMVVSSHVPVALEDKEDIEILKGVSGMLAGSSAPGGLVNYVLKQPTAQDLAHVETQVSERGSAKIHGDFGGRAGIDGAFGYRINLVAEEREPEIDHAWSKRALASGFFDWRAGSNTLLQFEFEHQKVREISVPGYGLLDTTGTGVAATLPPPIDPRINLNAQPWTQPFESSATSGSLRWTQQLGDGWSLLTRLGTQRSVTNDRIAFPDGCTGAQAYVYNGLCGNFDTDIYQYISNDERRIANDADARIKGHWHGVVDQELTAGLRLTRYSERYPPAQAYNFVGTTDVFAPQALPADPAPGSPNAPVDTHLDELYAFDVMHLPGKTSAWLGLRVTRIVQDSWLSDDSTSARLAQTLATPWAGAGWEPWAGGFAYASAGSGVETANAPDHATVRATGASLALANAGQVLPAQRSRQVEIGFKQRAGENLSFDAAAYRIEKPFVDDVPLVPNLSAIQVAGARSERHQGIELDARAGLAQDLRMRLALAFVDARTTRAVDPTWIGKPASNVAPLSLALQAEWTPRRLAGFAWSNLATFNSHKAVLPDGSVYLPDAWQWDSALRYGWSGRGLRWIARAGVDNVTNRTYWREAPMASWGSIYLFPAAARTARVGLGVDW
jgi:iron complex outermembrane recepter protein